MSTIVTRAGKGSPLTNNEIDSNFTNLNTDKLENGDLSVVTNSAGTAALAYSSGVFTYTPPDLSGYAALSGATFTGEVEATGFNGDLTGAILFKGQAGEALTKGDPVYISGISGNLTVVSKADADDASKMPCFGLVDATVSANAACSVVTFGTLQGLDTSSFSEGDELFVSATGTLTTTAPTGESALLQKIAKVTKSHASSGSVKVGAAGRTNATPNLDDGNFFLGNSSNQAVSADFDSSVVASLNGTTLAGNLIFPDNGKAIFGAGSDLQIYHDGSNSYIDETATGHLFIRSNGDGIYLRSSTNEEIAHFNVNGSVKAYYDNSLKLATTSTGIDVTGTASMDGLTVDGTAFVNLTSRPAGVPATAGALWSAQTETGNYGIVSKASSTDSFTYIGNTGSAATLGTSYGSSGSYLPLDLQTTDKKRLRIAANGDISFYEDTGTTAKFFWDASAESLGIGTTSPTVGKLQINDSSGATLAVTRTLGSTSGTLGTIRFGNTDIDSNLANIVAFQDGATDSGAVKFETQAAGGATTERARLDSAGNLLLGKTTTGVSGAGIVMRGGGELFVTRAGDVMNLNRLSTDGEIMVIRKDGANKGSMGTVNGDGYVSVTGPITGGVKTSVTSTSTTITSGTHLYVSAAGQTITLPASPSQGAKAHITVGNFTDTVVARNGSNIMGDASDMTLDTAYLSIQFIYVDATRGWVMT